MESEATKELRQIKDAIAAQYKSFREFFDALLEEQRKKHPVLASTYVTSQSLTYSRVQKGPGPAARRRGVRQGRVATLVMSSEADVFIRRSLVRRWKSRTEDYIDNLA